MEALLSSLTHAIEGAPALALGAAFLWGILSVILSPCHLASIPLIVGFIDDQGRVSTRRAFVLSLLFAVGILITIAAIGALTAAAGRMLGDLGAWANYVVAGVFVLVGLHLLGVLPAPWSAPGQAAPKRRGLWAALLLGLIFGIALGPCTFAYLAPILGITFKLSATRPLYGLALLLLFAAGHCAVLVLAGTSAGWVQRYLDWNEHARGPRILKAVCGVLVLLGAAFLVYATF